MRVMVLRCMIAVRMEFRLWNLSLEDSKYRVIAEEYVCEVFVVLGWLFEVVVRLERYVMKEGKDG